jgi:hypothetical protein
MREYIMNRWVLSSFAFVALVVGFSQIESPNFEKKLSESTPKSKDFTGKRVISSQDDIIKSINDKIVNIRSKDQILPLLAELNELVKNEENKSNHTLHLYHAVLTPLKHLEGVVWRLRQVVEKSGVMHLMALSTIRKAYYRDYLYGPHIKAVMDFIVEPNLDKPEFKNVSEVQNFLNDKVKETLEKSLGSIEKVMSDADDSWNFEFDAYLLSGYDEESGITFISQEKRYSKKVIKSHVNFVAAGIHRIIGAIEYSVNYNVNDLPKFVQDMVSLSAINSLKKKFFFRSLPKPITPMDVSKLLDSNKRKKYRKFLTLRLDKAVAQVNLTKSMNHFYAARKYELAGFEGSIDNVNVKDSKDYVLNPVLLNIDREDTVHKLSEIIALYKSGLKNKSEFITVKATGSSVEVNLSALFTAYDDLKTFIPSSKTGFNKDKSTGNYLRSDKNKKIKHNATNKKVYAWDYKYGKPVAWRQPTFGGFLPSATNENIYSIARNLKLSSALNVFAEFLPIP